MNIKRNIIKVLFVNILQVIVNGFIGFVIPAVLSIDEYSYYKTYTLIISYLGLLHFGYPDGIFIKYGGKNYSEIDKEKFSSEISTFLVIEFLLFIIILLIGLFINNIIMMIVAVTILPYMVTTFFKTFCQGIGDFNKYSKIITVYLLSTAVLCILFSFVLKIKDYKFYCLISVFANIISSIIVLYFLSKNKIKIKISIDFSNLKLIKVGFFILLGNLSFMLFFGIDRWFVKIFFSNEDFAYYSFAVNLFNIVTVLINAISITFYTYLFKNNSKEKLNLLKTILIVMGAMSSGVFFVLSFIIQTFLSKYMNSLNVISITFATFPYLIIINTLYVNLYKIQKKEKKYFKVIISMLTIAFIYNVIALITLKNNVGVAIATLISFITWFIYSYYDLKKFEIRKRDLLFLVLSTLLFLALSNLTKWYIGLLSYYIVLLLYSTTAYPKEIIYIINNISLKKILESRNSQK